MLHCPHVPRDPQIKPHPQDLPRRVKSVFWFQGYFVAAALECPPHPRAPPRPPNPPPEMLPWPCHHTAIPTTGHPPHRAPDRPGSSLTCGTSAVILAVSGRHLASRCGRVAGAVRARSGTQEAVRLAAARDAPIQLLAGRLGIRAHLEAKIPRGGDEVCFLPGFVATVPAMLSYAGRTGGSPKLAAGGPGRGRRWRTLAWTLALLFATLCRRRPDVGDGKGWQT